MDIRRLLGSLVAIIALGLLATAAVAQVLRPAPVLHDLAGRDDCLVCHQVGVMDMVTDVPSSHEGRESGVCLWCHAEDSPMRTIDPPRISHDIAGRDNCLMCHAPGAMDAVPDTPAHHEGRENSHCRMCHHTAD